MNSYEEKQERRRERLEERARRRRQKARAKREKADAVYDSIPLGEPIHGPSDRRRRDKAWSQLGASFRLEDEAEELARRARSVGSGGVSSDDPEAVDKLRRQLEETERRHAWEKRVNAAWRKAGKPNAQDIEAWKVVAGKLSGKSGPAGGVIEEATLEHLLPAMRSIAAQPGHGTENGLLSWAQPYNLESNTAKMRRLRERIEELREQATKAEEIGRENLGKGNGWGGWEVYVDYEENRVVFESAHKPPREVRQALKSRAFKWSRVRTAWVRKTTPRAMVDGQAVLKELESMDS